MTESSARTGMIWAAMICVYLAWGSTALGMRVFVEAGIPPLLGMGIRFLTAGLVLAGYLRLRHPGALRVTGRELRASATMGLLLLVLSNGVVAVALQTVPSGLTSLIMGAMPLWFVLLRVTGGERPYRLTWLGVLTGLSGVVLVSTLRGGMDGVEFWGFALLAFATVSWAVGSYVSPRLGLPRRALVASTYQMLVGGVVMVVVSLVSGEAAGLRMGEVPARGWVALGYLVLIGSLLGYTAYGFALANAPLSLVGTYAYVNPIVAVILGALILGEPITTIVITGGLLMVAGTAVVVTAERSPRAVADADSEKAVA